MFVEVVFNARSECLAATEDTTIIIIEIITSM